MEKTGRNDIIPKTEKKVMNIVYKCYLNKGVLSKEPILRKPYKKTNEPTQTPCIQGDSQLNVLISGAYT
jgi:hypothetical protein